MRVRPIPLTLTLALTGSLVSAQATPPGIDFSTITSSAWRVVNNAPTFVNEGGRAVARFGDSPQGALAWNPKIEIADRDIEFDAKGRDVLQGSFVGVAFRVRDDSTYDLVYLRPFNFRAADSARHAHALQYVAAPHYGWEKLRTEHPGVYETAIVPEPSADDWVHVRLELRGPNVRVYINGATKPALSVRALSGPTRGGVGIWVGAPSNGDFANLRVTAARLPGS